MIYRMPYLFDAVCVPKGSRKLDNFVFGGLVDVDIAETQMASLPVAARWLEPRIATGLLETRLCEGAHYMPMALHHRDGRLGASLGNPASVSWLMAYVAEAGKSGMSSYWSYMDFLQDKISIKEWDPASVRDVQASGMAEAREEAIRIAADFLLLVDGQLWVRVPEPKYQIMLPGRDIRENAAGAIMTVEGRLKNPYDFQETPPFRQPVFRADRYEDMLEYARERFPETEIAPCSQIDVLIPESFVFDDEGHAVRGTAADVAVRGFSMISHMNQSDALTWFNLRDRTEDGSETGEVAAALEAFGDALNGTAIKQDIEDALRRWRLRPIPDESFRP